MNTRTASRAAALVAAAVVTLVGLAQPAAAHPTLVTTLPEAGYSVAEPPEEIGLVFDERVTVTEFVLEGQARGTIPTTDIHQSPDGTRLTVQVNEPLPDGRYTVQWHVIGLDGHNVDGSFAFGVGEAAAPAAPAATQTSGLGSAVVLRWALVTAVALGLGGLVGDALARRRARLAGPDSGLDTPKPWLLPAGALGLGASAGLTLHSLGGGSLVDGVANASATKLVDTTSGRLVALEIVAFAVVVVATPRPHRRLAAVALSAVVIAEGWRSHLQAEAPPLGSITIMVHLAAVAIWVGALIHVLRTALRWRHRPGQAGGLLVEYAFGALLLFGVVVTTGTIAAILVLPTVDALWSTTYGQVLLAKLALVVVASGLAVAARRQLHHRFALRTIRLARIEWPALVAVLAASALLSSIEPPADPTQGLAYPPPAQGPTVRLGTLAGQITTGIIASEGQLEVRLRVPQWDPNARHDFDVTGTVTSPSGDETTLALQPCGAGCFVSPTRWGVGANTVELDIQAAEWQGTEATFDVPWPARDAEKHFAQMLATMTDLPALTFTESATSDTTRSTPFQSDELQTTGTELIDLQPYRSGVVNAPAVLDQDGDRTEIAFAVSAENIYVRQTLDADGRLVEETLVSPNHLLERTYRYPAADQTSG